jgi:hypothetical protein
MLTPLCQTVAKLYLCSKEGGNSSLSIISSIFFGSSYQLLIVVCQLYDKQIGEWKDTGIWGPACVVIDRTPPKAILIQIFDIRVCPSLPSLADYTTLTFCIILLCHCRHSI